MNNYQVIKNTEHENNAKLFIKENHYTKSVPRGCNQVFSLYENGELKGVASFGYPTGKNCIKKYGEGTVELKRVVLKNTEKNTASWFIAKCIKQLTKNNKRVISYADPKQGHEGTIYKASNFSYIGKQKYKTPVFLYKGKKFHLRCVYQDTKTGEFLRDLKKKKLLKKVNNPKKHIFIYERSKRNEL